jgi:hypothetical protein
VRRDHASSRRSAAGAREIWARFDRANSRTEIANAHEKKRKLLSDAEPYPSLGDKKTIGRRSPKPNLSSRSV